MNLFEISFVLYFLKLSNGSSFWTNLRNDKRKYRLAKKLRKYEFDFNLLVTCRDTGVYPKFTHWKHADKNKVKLKVLLQSSTG